MRRFLLSLVFILAVQATAQQTLGPGVRDLASQITTSAAKQEKQRIAVLPFRELEGPPTVFGAYLAEELVTNLFQLGNFKIVERQLLDKVLSELRIQRSGAIDPATAKEIGRIAAVDAIVTGSITELDSFISVNCRLIDTTTGEVFGAAQTRISKDDDVTKLMNAALTGESIPTPGSHVSHQTAKAIATKELGALRAVLKSVRPVTLVNRWGQQTRGLRWTFEFVNREARKAIEVALNAEAWESGSDSRYSSGSAPLRSSVLDDRGKLWTTSSAGLGSIGFVRAGVHGRDGQQVYSAAEIVRLLRLRDRLGRDTDDPADGTSDSTGRVSGYRLPGDPPPPTFFPYEGNRFISGTTTTIPPGQSVVVAVDFSPNGGEASTIEPTSFQFNSEIVVGVVETERTKSYSLHNLTFDRVTLATVR